MVVAGRRLIAVHDESAPMSGQPRIRVVINGRFLAQPTTGVQRFAREVLRALDTMPGWKGVLAIPSDVVLVTADGVTVGGLPLARTSVRRVGRLTGHAWEQFELPFATGGRPLVNLCNTAPLALWRQVVVIHDAGVFDIPQAYQPAFRAWYRLLYAWHGRRAQSLASVSRFSADRLHEVVVPHSRPIHVLGNSGEHILRQPADDAACGRLGLEGSPFILTVGSLAPHKNLAVVRAAKNLLGDGCPPIVAVGSLDSRVVRGAGGSGGSGILCTGRVSDAELRGLYERATCLVYPSLYEGFGIPPLEAMACGCPVIASDASSIPEACGESALLFDPASPESLAGRLSALLADDALRARLAAQGRDHAAARSWENVASRLVEVIAATMPDAVT